MREVVAHLDVDRPLHTDHNAMAAAVRERRVLAAVDAEVGEQAMYQAPRPWPSSAPLCCRPAARPRQWIGVTSRDAPKRRC